MKWQIGSNQLSVIISKTKYILVKPNNNYKGYSNLGLKINGIVRHTQFLELVIDDKLNWTEH